VQRQPTYYELFKISSTASAREVRRAYLQVMKDYHPDVSASGGAEVDLSFYNQIYETLRDPVKRAAYDAELARGTRPWPFSAKGTGAPAKSVRIGPRSLASSLIPLGGVAVVALLILSIATDPSPFDQSTRAIGPPERRLLASENRLDELPSSAAICRQALTASTMSSRHAVSESRSCFGSASAEASLAAAQLCVVFDNAFLYSRTSPEGALPPYYNPLVVRLRHASALADFGSPEPMMEGLLKATFAALKANLEQPTRSIDAVQKRNMTGPANRTGGPCDA
jgi:hypothetical protein